MTAITLTRGDAGAAEVPLPRRRRGLRVRAALAAIGGSLAVLVPIVFLVIAGSLWIMTVLNHNMMPMAPAMHMSH